MVLIGKVLFKIFEYFWLIFYKYIKTGVFTARVSCEAVNLGLKIDVFKLLAQILYVIFADINKTVWPNG